MSGIIIAFGCHREKSTHTFFMICLRYIRKSYTDFHHPLYTDLQVPLVSWPLIYPEIWAQIYILGFWDICTIKIHIFLTKTGISLVLLVRIIKLCDVMFKSIVIVVHPNHVPLLHSMELSGSFGAGLFMQYVTLCGIPFPHI